MIGINPSDFNSIKAMFIKDTKGAYEILGVNQSQNNDEIKLNYNNIGKNKLFYDVIYNPKETNFLKIGKKLTGIFPVLIKQKRNLD